MWLLILDGTGYLTEFGYLFTIQRPNYIHLTKLDHHVCYCYFKYHIFSGYGNIDPEYNNTEFYLLSDWILHGCTFILLNVLVI